MAPTYLLGPSAMPSVLRSTGWPRGTTERAAATLMTNLCPRSIWLGSWGRNSSAQSSIILGCDGWREKCVHRLLRSSPVIHAGWGALVGPDIWIHEEPRAPCCVKWFFCSTLFTHVPLFQPSIFYWVFSKRSLTKKMCSGLEESKHAQDKYEAWGFRSWDACSIVASSSKKDALIDPLRFFRRSYNSRWLKRFLFIFFLMKFAQVLLTVQRVIPWDLHFSCLEAAHKHKDNLNILNNPK